ncbi:MAG TPA: HAD family phosphatase [Candidatus Saccharimonadales bacterium]|nr:HAD family phosphatase [Candidatus Saccharimonadales bacterium]
MIRAVIFDCFGVIVGKGFDYTYTLAGGDPKQDRQFLDDKLKQANLGLISENDFNKAMAKNLGQSDSEWQAILAKAEKADAELLDYIASLRKKYKTAVLSNSNKGVLKQKIGEEQLEKCFDEVVCSAEVGMIKPSPHIYKLTANRLKVEPEECVFIDDHVSFVEAAKTIGMHALVYKDLPSLKHALEALAVNPKT